VGLHDLEQGASSIRQHYPDLFPNPGSDWDLRMAVLYRFAKGGGTVRSFLNVFGKDLAALPESQRWDFLRGKRVEFSGKQGRIVRVFEPENVDKKMTLAAKLGRVPGPGGAAPVSVPQPATPAPARPSAPSRPAADEIASGALPSRFGYRLSGGRRRLPVYGIVVHTTGSGPAIRALANVKQKRGCQTALDCGLKYYYGGGGGFPHYVIDFEGLVHCTCPENYTAWHAAWTKETSGRHFWKAWSPPEWWARVWGKDKTPLDLIPADAGSPNSRHLGIEILGRADSGKDSDAQYQSLARLIVDIDRRHGLGIDRAPSTKLLGHEDVNPLTGEGGRANAHGGWDPGAHRVAGATPRFSWERLWSLVEQARQQHELGEPVQAYALEGLE
jgi:hypothetical protein